MTDRTGISVSELNRMVSEAIRKDPRTRSVTVRGEVSGFKNHLASGHWYFSLKDPDAAVSCVMYRSNAIRAQIRPRDGDMVLVDGYADVYPPQGKYQLYVTGMRSAGLGDLFIRLEELKRRLEAEGLFDPGRKKPLPLVPRKVAVVTSASGAALHDILNVSRLRSPWIPVVLIPTAVQGTDAGREIAESIRKADEGTDADVIIVGRGGGSAEDLWCFNDEAVVRAVAACRKPVVSGVGHEVDHTLCDLAADVRASTPSNAAEIVFPDRKELEHRTGMIGAALLRAQTQALRSAELAVRTAQQRLSALSPEKRIGSLLSGSQLIRERMISVLRSALERKAAELKEAGAGLGRAATDRIRETENRTARLRERLTAVDPLAVLSRGYAMVYDMEGKLLTRAAEAGNRRDMTLQFSDGRISVTRKEEP